MPSPLLLLIAAPVVIGLVIACLKRPLTFALPVFAALVPFGGLIAVGTSRFGSLSSLVGVLLGVGLVLRLIVARRVSVPLSATVPLWLLFLATAGATTLWSLDANKTATGFVILGSLSGVYILIALSGVDRDILHRTEQGLILGGVAAVGWGLLQLTLLGGFPNDVPGMPPGPGGRFGNDMLGPNNEAVALLLPLMICLHRSVTAAPGRFRNQHTALAGVLFLGVVMTGSRGGILAVFLSILILIASAPAGRRKLLSYLAIGVVAGAIAFFLHPFGLAQREVQTTSSSGRTDIWRVGLAACPDYCPLGAGWENFPLVYAETQPKVPDAAVLVGTGGAYQPHNVILLVAIELGLPGLILLFAVLGLTMVEAWRLPRTRRGPPLAALLGTYVAAMFLSNLEFKFFWMALFMVALHRNLSYAEDPQGLTRPSAAPTERLVTRHG